MTFFATISRARRVAHDKLRSALTISGLIASAR